jgi:hypothetical protein
VALRWRDLFGEDHPDDVQGGSSAGSNLLWKLLPPNQKRAFEYKELRALYVKLGEDLEKMPNPASEEAKQIKTMLEYARQTALNGMGRCGAGKK